MTYTPGTIRGRYRRGVGPDGDVAHTGEVQLIPSTSPARDLTGATIVAGSTFVPLDDEGEFSVEVAPYGPSIDPVNLTWTVIAHLDDGQLPPVTGIRVDPSEVVEVAEQTSVVPEPDVPNVQRLLEEYAAAAASSVTAAADEADQAADSATTARNAELSAIAAQEAAAAVQLAVLEQVAIATQKATDASTSAGQAATSAQLAADRLAAMPTLPVLRTNRARNPRGAQTGYQGEYVARFGWTTTYLTGRSDGPAPGVTSWIRVVPPAGNPGAGTARGVNLFGNEQGGAPGTSGSWRDFPVAPGDKVAISGWMRTSAVLSGQTFLHSLRFHDGAGSWVSATTSGANVAPASDNAWTWCTVTATAPAGAAYIAGGRYAAGSFVWTGTDWIDIGPLFIEVNGVLAEVRPADYFDRSTGGARSSGTPDASATELVTPRSIDLLSGAHVIEGSGSPVGTVSAPIGWRYFDLAATTGAREWLSTAPGTAGWVVAYGDTGWRQIKGLQTWHASVDSANAGTNLLICRVGERVYLELCIYLSAQITVATDLIAAAAAPQIGVLGWKPSNSGAVIHRWRAGNGSGGDPVGDLIWHQSPANGYLRYAPGAGIQNSTVIRSAYSWATSDPWPTTLPGTSV